MPEETEGSSYRLEIKSGSALLVLPCRETGIFDYTVRQLPGEDPDCSYDDACFRLRLIITESEEGCLQIETEIYCQDGDAAASILFRNRWAAPAWVGLSAEKVQEYGSSDDGDFTFVLLTREGEVAARAENRGKDVLFPMLRFDREGIYRYELKEQPREGREIFCDRTVYTVLVQVEKDGDYKASVSYLRNGVPYEGTPVFSDAVYAQSPQTGDSIGFFCMMLILSFMSILVLLVKYKKTVR